MRFLARMQGGKIVLPPEQRNLMDYHVRTWKDDTVVWLDVKRVQNPLSDRQRRTIFGLAIAFIKRELDDRGIDLATFLHSDAFPPGQEVPVEVIKEYLYATCGNVGDNGERKRLSTPMSTAECSRFFEKIREHMAAKWCVVIPDPNPLWRATADEKELTP